MKNFYLFYGTNKSLIQHELNKLIQKLAIADPIKYDMTTEALEDVIEDAKTIGMFQPQKIIILENANFLCANKTVPKLELLEEYLDHYNPNTYLIFLVNNEKIDTRKKISKKIKEKGIITELNKIEKNYLQDYIQTSLSKNHYQMEDIAYFLNKVGTNIENIKNELDKLYLYKLESKQITNKDIDKITPTTLEEEIFSLTDAIILNNTKKAMELLEEFLNKGHEELQIIMLLASQFRFLLQVKLLLNKNKNYTDIAKTLEVNPYRVKYTIDKLYQYTAKDLMNIQKKIAKMDHDIKLGLTDKRLALEMFILEGFIS